MTYRFLHIFLLSKGIPLTTPVIQVYLEESFQLFYFFTLFMLLLSLRDISMGTEFWASRILSILRRLLLGLCFFEWDILSSFLFYSLSFSMTLSKVFSCWFYRIAYAICGVVFFWGWLNFLGYSFVLLLSLGKWGQYFFNTFPSFLFSWN